MRESGRQFSSFLSFLSLLCLLSAFSFVLPFYSFFFCGICAKRVAESSHTKHTHLDRGASMSGKEDEEELNKRKMHRKNDEGVDGFSMSRPRSSAVCKGLMLVHKTREGYNELGVMVEFKGNVPSSVEISEEFFRGVSTPPLSRAPSVGGTPPVQPLHDDKLTLDTCEVTIEKEAGSELPMEFEGDNLRLTSTGSPLLKHLVYKYALTHVGGHPVMNMLDVITSAKNATVLKLRFKEYCPHTTLKAAPDFSGWLEKKGLGLIKLYRRRWCELHKQYLHYSAGPGERSLGRINLAGAAVDVCECEGRQHAFAISGDLPRTYEMAADTLEERNAWVRAITKTINWCEIAGISAMEDWLESLLPSTEAGMSLKDFQMGEVIGRGSFAKVIKVRLKTPDSTLPNSSSGFKDRQKWLKDSLHAFYMKYREERAPMADTIASHSVGQEVELYRKLLERYPHGEEDLQFLLNPPGGQEESRGNVFAMKVVKKSALPSVKIARMMMEEKAILQSMKHPYIVALHYAFQTDVKLYLVMTYLGGGDLRTHLTRDRKFSEPRTKFYASQILLALDHLHTHGIVYRDLKPQNVVLDGDGHAVLTDLGLATDITESGRAYTFCGTPSYVAPEVLEGAGYKKAVDFWSLGVMVYEMLVGATPFQGGDRLQDMFLRIMEESVRYPSWVSKQAREVVTTALERDPDKRASNITLYKPMKFFKGINWADLRGRKIPPPFRPPLDTQARGERPITDLNQSHSHLPPTPIEIESQFEGFAYSQQLRMRPYTATTPSSTPQPATPVYASIPVAE
eukprot:TRINITY_DN19431_c0_g1_i1.p1 TRINITY_DN19431_c0_g1~~TRINITY_DN19431_c0_g1_i1.p1  ORF type:complete len:807 (+),score=107.33 TRINITY_DN19431_c0_g1_i1:42-2423(+)